MCGSFDLKSACGNCPFRKEGGIRLNKNRITGIIDVMEKDDNIFHCHKTLDLKEKKICAGWLIFGKKIGILNNNFPIRLAQMAKIFNPDELVNEHLVFDSKEEAIQANTGKRSF